MCTLLTDIPTILDLLKKTYDRKLKKDAPKVEVDRQNELARRFENVLDLVVIFSALRVLLSLEHLYRARASSDMPLALSKNVSDVRNANHPMLEEVKLI